MIGSSVRGIKTAPPWIAALRDCLDPETMKREMCIVLVLALCGMSDAAGLLERRRAGISLVPSSAASAQPWNAGTGLKCVSWRKTLTCTPSGPRDPLRDKDCLTVIPSEESGYCECEGYVHTAAVPCGHDPVNCTQECGVLQKLHREVFGADYVDNGMGMTGGPGGLGGPGGVGGSQAVAAVGG